MRGPETLTAIRPNSTEYISGVQVTATVIEPLVSTVQTSDVEDHEAEHAVVAVVRGVGARRARSKWSGNGVGGFVEPYIMDSVVAATSHNRKGNGHDMRLLKAGGVNPDSAISVAEDIMASHRREIRAVAELLHNKGDVSGSEVEKAMESVDREEERKVLLKLKTKDGQEKTMETTTNSEGAVVLPGEWIVNKKSEKDEKLMADKEREPKPIPIPFPKRPNEAPEEDLPKAA